MRRQSTAVHTVVPAAFDPAAIHVDGVAGLHVEWAGLWPWATEAGQKVIAKGGGRGGHGG